MNVEEAKAFARKHFPSGPEKLAEHLGIEVRYSKLEGCDGWCLTAGSNSLIRINEDHPKSRQRFTLAHELGHLLLGIPTVIGETWEEMLGSNSEEERRVNAVAAEILMPIEVVRNYIQRPPVIVQSLSRLAKAANVSFLAAAIRVTNAAAELSLLNAGVLRFERSELKWMWSPSLQATTAETPLEVLRSARATHPAPYREVQKDGDVVVASLIDNPKYDSTTVFVQLLPREHAFAQSLDERRRQLELALFPAGDGLRPSVEGCFGAFKSKISGLTLSQAEKAFWERYSERFSSTPMNSENGRLYVNLRLSEWCGESPS